MAGDKDGQPANSNKRKIVSHALADSIWLEIMLQSAQRCQQQTWDRQGQTKQTRISDATMYPRHPLEMSVNAWKRKAAGSDS
jgi:hypothetical protein